MWLRYDLKCLNAKNYDDKHYFEEQIHSKPANSYIILENRITDNQKMWWGLGFQEGSRADCIERVTPNSKS